MGDFNLNWLDKVRRKKLNDINKTFQMTQMINKPTRITKSSQTLLDWIFFTNKADRITKTYSLITGLLDHKLTLSARKLPKTRYRNKNQMGKNSKLPFIPKKVSNANGNKMK